MNLIRNFLQDEQGQDLIEYTLLLAFVCLASAGLSVANYKSARILAF
jgi:Flp pilus assembly pilin Flp